MSKVKKGKTYHATWEMRKDPLYVTDCPRCKAVIIMSTPSLVERLKRWAKGLK